MASAQNGTVAGWQLKVHELKFTPQQIAKLKKADEKSKSSLHDILVDLAVDNCSIKIKSVEHYGSYTFSYTLDKAHPQSPGHTWWFYDTDLGRGIRVMYFFVREMLPDWIGEDAINEASGLW